MSSAAASEQGLNPGDDFNGYEIVRRLGAGAFGAVYEARRQPLQKRVALKVLHAEHARNPATLERFLREAQIVAQVEHPNIVGVMDVAVHGASPYIVMELLDGQSLAQRIARGGALPLDEAVDLMLPVLSAMAVVHERGIVHRDLKPDNIFLARLPTGASAPKLLDFGIAKVRGAERALTVTSAIMGTPCYMSPEQATESKHVDAQSDQWALAVILFEAVAGRCPFRGESLLAVLTAITSGPAPRLRAFDPGAPEALEAVLLRAMERAPAARFPSVRAFGEALLPFASHAARAQWAGYFSGASATVPAPPPAAIPEAVPDQHTLDPATRPSITAAPPARRRGLAVVGAAALATVLAAGSWLALRGAAPPAHARAATAAPPVAAAVHAQHVAPTPVAVPPAPAPAPAAQPTAPAPAAQPAVTARALTEPSAASENDDAPAGRRHRSRRHRRSRDGDAPTPAATDGFANF